MRRLTCTVAGVGGEGNWCGGLQSNWLGRCCANVAQQQLQKEMLLHPPGRCMQALCRAACTRRQRKPTSVSPTCLLRLEHRSQHGPQSNVYNRQLPPQRSIQILLQVGGQAHRRLCCCCGWCWCGQWGSYHHWCCCCGRDGSCRADGGRRDCGISCQRHITGCCVAGASIAFRAWRGRCGRIWRGRGAGNDVAG